MQLDQLPEEILLEIIDHLAQIPSVEFQPSWSYTQYGVTQKIDLIRFSEVSKKLHSLARPKIFEAITIKASAGDQASLDEELYLQPFPSTFSEDHGPLRFVKSIKVATAASRGSSGCCLHLDLRDVSDASSSFNSGSDDDTQSNHRQLPPDDIEAYGTEILALLKLLEPGILRSFHWDLGTCVPDILFGKSGYLPTYQNKIENLSLTTDGSCLRSANKKLPGLNIQKFTSLLGVSWRGIQNYSELNALRLLLDNNASHLNSLELSLLECQYYQSFFEIEISGSMQNLLSTTILGLSLSDMRLNFPSLESLSLSGIQLSCTDVDIQHMISALNIHGLRKLRLLRCTSVIPFLQAIVETKTNLHFESLELEIFDKTADEDLLYQNTVSTLLSSFKGLQEFYLRTDLVQCPSDIWTAINRHRMTLRQLVWHDRRGIFFQEASREVDHSALYDMFNDGSQYATQFPLLESVGLGTNCHFKKLFEMPNLSFLDNVKLLHLRGTRKDLENEGLILYNLLGIDKKDSLEMLSDCAMDFARWAFGPHGFPKLRVLACGDPHSQDSRQGNWMLCKSTPSVHGTESFRWTSLTTCEELAGIANSFQVLSACPIDPQMQ